MKDYPFISDFAEQERLRRQGEDFREATEIFFGQLGLAPGMRVLDVGCGTGQVSAVLADLLGSGHIVGIDRDEKNLLAARQAVPERKGLQVEFVHSTFADYSRRADFDAIVGRLVLMYSSNPTAELQHARSLILPGGVIGFLEADHTKYCCPEPDSPLFKKYRKIMDQVSSLCEITTSLGLTLKACFLNAGFSNPQQVALPRSTPLDHESIFDRWAATCCKMQQWLFERGEEVACEDPKLVAEAMQHEARTHCLTAYGSQLVGVYAREA